MLKNELSDILSKVKRLEQNKENCTLPANSYFLNSDEICCFERDFGDSRYPYSYDGFTLWAHSSGTISINESAFYIILPAFGGKEPFASFFAGIKKEDGTFEPIALQAVNKQLVEKDYKRYTVYTPKVVYYITETPKVTVALRCFVTKDKEVFFSLIAQNNSNYDAEIYLASYINCFLRRGNSEDIESNWFRTCSVTDNGYLFSGIENVSRTQSLTHYGALNRAFQKQYFKDLSKTTARSVFIGSSCYPINCAKSLLCGKFAKKKERCSFTDTPSAGDIVTYVVPSKEYCRVDYRLRVIENKNIAEAPDFNKFDIIELDKLIESVKKADELKFSSNDMLKITFDNWLTGNINSSVFNSFLKNVQRQVEFAALAKNSGLSLLGVRDVLQQLEASLLWNPKACRAKIIEVLGFIDVSGRPSRQYSIPLKPASTPLMDLRPFIDQGVWIISTVYSYLCHTGDYSILDEICGYYKFLEGNRVEYTDIKDSVLEHLIKVMDYLLSNLDYENTNCLKALYGDWNDALDGLGTTNDPNQTYGTGVSVMASLQLYQNLNEMTEILRTIGKKESYIEKYLKCLELLKQGLIKHSIVKNENNEMKILHGWGDKKSYCVGSFCDTDGANRDSLTSNAFWALSGALKWDTSVKDTILKSFSRLDSKYGLKTFEPYFPKDMKGVGRIVNLPKGTAENSATYVHASMFGIWALFEMNEPVKAWEQLEKILPFTHSLISTTPFVMSNSYSYNEEFEMDGESMSDWFTGSANVLIKALVRGAFGINTSLNGLTITPSRYFPAENGSMCLKAKNVPIMISYKNKKIGKPQVLLNGVPQSLTKNILNRDTLFIENDKIKGTLKIEVIV